MITTEEKEELKIALYGSFGLYQANNEQVGADLNFIKDKPITMANSTLLFENTSGLDSGNITLSQPYTDFDKLIVIVSGDGAGELSPYVVDVKLMLETHAMAIAKNKHTTIFINHYYWTINKTSTTTAFYHIGNNCRIWAIYGWKENA